MHAIAPRGCASIARETERRVGWKKNSLHTRESSLCQQRTIHNAPPTPLQLCPSACLNARRFDCVFQTDMFGLVGSLHVLVFGQYMKVYCSQGHWHMTSSFQRSVSQLVALWVRAFFVYHCVCVCVCVCVCIDGLGWGGVLDPSVSIFDTERQFSVIQVCWNLFRNTKWPL